MATALTLDSVRIPVAWDGHLQRYEDLGEATRSGAGYLRSNVTAGLGRGGVLPLETPQMTLAEGEVVEADLATLGQREADGYLVGDIATQVYVRNLVREDPTPGLMRLTFELHLAGATT